MTSRSAWVDNFNNASLQKIVDAIPNLIISIFILFIYFFQWFIIVINYIIIIAITDFTLVYSEMFVARNIKNPIFIGTNDTMELI